MRKVIKIDSNGLYIEDVVLQGIDSTPHDCIDLHCPDGLYKPKWTGSEWIEGLSQEDISNLQSAEKPTEEDKLKDRISALEDALLFLMG